MLAGVHVEVCQTIHSVGRKVYRRLLRHDSGAHQVDLRCSARRVAARAGIAYSRRRGRRVEITPPDIKVVPPEERSHWGRKIAQGEFVTSVEVLPPKGVDAKKTLDSIRLLKDAGVDGVNIPDGARAQSRMSALATAVLVEQQIGIETVLHYCCRDRNLLGMMSDLLGAAALGLRNILVITGDPPKMGPYPDATAVFDIDSIGLTNMVNKLNHGLDLGNNPIGEPTAFCIGVGVNPGAINLDEEIKRFEWKVEAGAQYAITQPVFDTDQLRDFLKRIEHVRIPIIAGIWPLVSYRNAEFLHNEVPGVRVTPSIMERMRDASAISKEAGRDEGLKIARESLMEVRDEIQGVQVSAPFGNVKYALEVFEVLPEFSHVTRRKNCTYSPRSSFLKAGSSLGHRNAKPSPVKTAGSTVWLESNNASAISPNARRTPKAGTGKNVGRERRCPSVFVNSALVTGFGETKFTGPRRPIANRNYSRANHVVERDPTHPLFPASHTSANSHPKRRQHFLQRSAVAIENDAEAREDGADSLLRCRSRRFLPLDADMCEEIFRPARFFPSTVRRRGCRSSRSPTRRENTDGGRDNCASVSLSRVFLSRGFHESRASFVGPTSLAMLSPAR